MATDPLEPYWKKRDFTLTAEPRGTVTKAQGALSFVIQKHAASRLHYDFRLELDGTLKSWAVPTGWQAVVQCDVQPTDTVAIWGAGPVGQFAIRSAILLGAKQVIAIDRVPERLTMAAAGGAITINFEEESVVERLNELTNGKGPEKCIDAVGMEAHVTSTIDAIYDRAKQAVMLETDRPHVLREMIYVCRPAGILSIPGVYGGLADKLPIGALMNKGLTVRTGQTHVNRWTDDLLRRIEEGQIDPSFVITHTVTLDKGPEMYKTFRDKQDGCIKVVMKPQ